MDNCLSLNISYNNQTFRKGIMSVPFKIVFQTSSKTIEKYCKENYPKLMTYSIYGFREAISSGLGAGVYWSNILILIAIGVAANLMLLITLRIHGNRRFQHESIDA